MFEKRGCGVLLHPTSLPGREGIGTLGGEARKFIDVLAAMGMSYWQVLPLTPPACGNSPYSAYSAFAGNPLLIDIQQLVEDGLLSSLPDVVVADNQWQVDFEGVACWKTPLLEEAAVKFLADDSSPLKKDFWHFCDTTPWLHYYALFMACKKRYHGKPWYKWPSGIALLTPAQYEKLSVQLGTDIGVHKFIQWLFFRQWQSLRTYAAENGIAIIGDIPIFVGYDSADVWSNRNIFLLDSLGKPTAVAGVPPDYFSATGQLWGNPLYDWQVLEAQGFSWWLERFRSMFALYDVVRIDHFRGFEAAWQVPVKEKTAIRGAWVEAPGQAFFDTLKREIPQLPVIAEDLGVITPEVTALKERYGFPGMKILHFAFDSDAGNPYLPHNHEANAIVYTGTHDNDTTAGWYSMLTSQQQWRIEQYLGRTGEEAVVCAALMSVAHTAILPFQDILKLGSEARMNVPGTAFGNWGWRFTWEMVTKDMATHFYELVERYGRLNPVARRQPSK